MLIFLFGLLSLSLLLLFLLLRFGFFLLCSLWLLFLFLRLGFFLLYGLWLLFLFLWFGLFLLRSGFSLFLMLRWLSAVFLVLFLRERRNSRCEKQKQGRCADDAEYFHACYLRYENSGWTSD